jgi:hypothetical protein
MVDKIINEIIADQRKRYGDTRLSPEEKALPKEKTAAYARRMWMTGRYTPRGIIALVYLNFGKWVTRKYVNQIYNGLKKRAKMPVPDWKEDTVNFLVQFNARKSE